jgi:hypothetical protein
MLARLSFSAILLTLPPAMANPEPPFKKSETPATLQAPAIKEASGLAPSLRSDDALWLINDSGAPANLHLINTDGSDRGSLALSNTINRDWEDLAAFTWKDKPHLLIADTGDNAAQHPSCTLIIVEEPPLPAPGKTLAGTITPAWTIRFGYPDGPRDCEAVAVDAAAGKILLVTKRDTPPRIYQLPLRPSGNDVQTATFLGTTQVTPPPGTLHPFGAQPTALDLSPDGKSAALLSYIGIFHFPRQPGETWQAALARKPAMLEPHRLQQAESLAFSKNGKSLITLSEGNRSPILTYQKR